ncbi:succinate dehydrogenase assembly factor 2 [Magnetospira thiophila]
MDPRRKRLLFRANHMGMHETDLLLGGFAQAYLAVLDESLVTQFEALLKEGDNDLLNWITGKEPPPAAHDNDLMRRLWAFKDNSLKP